MSADNLTTECKLALIRVQIVWQADSVPERFMYVFIYFVFEKSQQTTRSSHLGKLNLPAYILKHDISPTHEVKYFNV